VTPRVDSPALARSAACAGLLAVAWAFLVPTFGGLQPGYSHTAQFISELGAQGAPFGAVVSLLGFGINGLLVFAFIALRPWRRSSAPFSLR
jgi:hypothetical protein